MFDTVIEELAELTSSELDAVIANAELTKRRADARLAAAVAVVAERASYHDHGHISIRSYLKGQLNCSGTVANKIRRRADLITQHPHIGHALFNGRISIEHTDLLAKAASHRVAGERFDAFAPRLLDGAEHLDHQHFGTVITHFINRADPDGSFNDQQFRADQRVATISVVHGALDLRATGGTPLATHEINAVFDAAIQAEFDKDCATRRAEHGNNALAAPLPRTARQRKFDALHAIFMASVAAPADAKTPEPLVNIVIDHVTAGTVLAAHGLVGSADIIGIGTEAFAIADADLMNRQCSINGTPVHPDIALQALITGRVRRAVIDADGVTINLGRTRRLFTGKARQAAQLLAITCTHRGCDIPANLCDIDHRAEWNTDTGTTDQHNAMPMCGIHDRWKHTNRIRSRRAANGRIYLIRPDGSTIKPVGETEPQWTEPEPVGSTPSTPAPSQPRTTNTDPWAPFGEPINAELVANRFPPNHNWTIRTIDVDALPTR